MPARRSFCEGGPACRLLGCAMAGRFTDIAGYTALMGSDKDRTFIC